MSYYKIVAVTGGIVLVFAGFFIFFRVGKEFVEVGLPAGSPTSETSEVEGPPAGTQPAGSPTSKSISEEQTFTHPKYLFSFKYPKDFNATSFEDGEGDMVLVQSKDSKSGFQMYITPFDEPGPITTKRVKKDLPDIMIEDPQQIELRISANEKTNQRESRIPALIFFSQSESLGRTREVWFLWPEDPKLAGNYLYQVTAPAESDKELSKIMATFKFE